MYSRKSTGENKIVYTCNIVGQRKEAQEEKGEAKALINFNSEEILKENAGITNIFCEFA